MAGFSINFDYKSNGADVAKLDAGALSDLADQLEKVGGSSSAAESGMSASFSGMAAQIRQLAAQASDIPMALKTAVQPEQLEGVISKPVGEDVEKAEGSLDDLKEAGKGVASNLAFSAGQIGSAFGDGPGGLLQALGESAGYMAMDGPLGLAIAGIGGLVALIGSAWEADKAKQEAAQAAILKETQTFYDEMLASGKSYLQNSDVDTNIKAIGDSTTEYAQAQKIAADSGASLSTVIRALAGDTDAQSQVQQKLNSDMSIGSESAKAMGLSGKALQEQTDRNNSSFTADMKVIDGVGTSMGGAASKAATVKDAMDNVGKSGTSSATSVSNAAKKIKGAVDEIPANKTITVDVDSTSAEAKLTKLNEQFRTIANTSITVPVVYVPDTTKLPKVFDVPPVGKSKNG